MAQPNHNDLKDQFEAEMERMKQGTVLDPAYRRKRLIMYIIRTALAIAIYYFLWEYKWVRWTLLLYIPINLVGLFSIIGMSYLLNKKIGQTNQEVDDAGRAIEDIEYEELD